MAQSRDVRITKCDHEGHPLLTYLGQRVYADEQKAIARCAWGAQSMHDLGPFALCPGDIMIETFYAQEWFNVFAIYYQTGRFKGWYCNITLPTMIENSAIDWYDLALDLLILPNGRMVELDRDEFEEMVVDAATRDRANQAMAELRRWARDPTGPFFALANGPTYYERGRCVRDESAPPLRTRGSGAS